MGNEFLKALFWGFILWLFGYILGIILFMFVPKDVIGFYVMPFGIIATVLVLLKKIGRKNLQDYAAIGVIWTIVAILFDYVFIVQMLKAPDYYKLDVYLYYILAFVLPLIVGWYKLNKAGR